nr:hypothetical protein CFP56_78968 [Quercus suber]
MQCSRQQPRSALVSSENPPLEGKRTRILGYREAIHGQAGLQNRSFATKGASVPQRCGASNITSGPFKDVIGCHGSGNNTCSAEDCHHTS